MSAKIKTLRPQPAKPRKLELAPIVVELRYSRDVAHNIRYSTTGIDIHPGAKIGPGLYIDRGMGVTIGETAVIGENVCHYHGVTLGEAEFVQTTARRTLRHPVIKDNVIIHAGASVLGRITVGAGSIIGGNVWLTRSISPGSSVTQAAHAVSTIHSLD